MRISSYVKVIIGILLLVTIVWFIEGQVEKYWPDMNRTKYIDGVREDYLGR